MRVLTDTEYAAHQQITAVSQFKHVTACCLIPTISAAIANRPPEEILCYLRHRSNSDCSVQHTFGIRLASFSNVRVETKTGGDIMEALVSCSSVCYAVIEASTKIDGSKRMVIAYQDENCLRDLIAASSIDGLGFASRQEAMANTEHHMPDTASSKQKLRITATFDVAHKNSDLLGGLGIVAQRRKAHAILHTALATIATFFYSKSVVSVMIRIAVGASF